jgi:hypothetical protein
MWLTRRPNTRVQRTRSSASPPRSPLTRHPLGGFRLELVARVMVAAWYMLGGVSPCGAGELTASASGDVPAVPPRRSADATCPVHGIRLRQLLVRITSGESSLQWPDTSMEYAKAMKAQFPLADFDRHTGSCLVTPGEYDPVLEWCCVDCVKARRTWIASHEPSRLSPLPVGRSIWDVSA